MSSSEILEGEDTGYTHGLTYDSAEEMGSITGHKRRKGSNSSDDDSFYNVDVILKDPQLRKWVSWRSALCRFETLWVFYQNTVVFVAYLFVILSKCCICYKTVWARPSCFPKLHQTQQKAKYIIVK